MKYGLDIKILESIKDVFLRHHNVEKVIIYGSRAIGNYRNSSDIDLTLFGNELTLKEQFEIENELDDLLLPYKFDLSLFHKIENPDLIDHINRKGKIFFQRN